MQVMRPRFDAERARIDRTLYLFRARCAFATNAQRARRGIAKLLKNHTKKICDRRIFDPARVALSSRQMRSARLTLARRIAHEPLGTTCGMSRFQGDCRRI
jgi:hypothetical protein